MIPERIRKEGTAGGGRSAGWRGFPGLRFRRGGPGRGSGRCRHGAGEAEGVGDEGEGDALLAEGEEVVEEDARLFEVEGRGDLVEEEALGLQRQGAGEGGPLALAAGDGVRVAGKEGLHPEGLREGGDEVGDLLLRFSGAHEREGDVLPEGEVGPEEELLEDDGELRPGRGGILRVREEVGDAVDAEGAAVGLLDEGEGAEEGRLAAAARADDGGDFPGAEFEREVVEDGLAVARFPQVLRFQERRAHCSYCSERSRVKRCLSQRARPLSGRQTARKRTPRAV